MAVMTSIAVGMAAYGVGVPLTASVISGLTYLASTVTGMMLMSAATSMALNALTPKPRMPATNLGYAVSSTGAALSHQVIYGETRIGGVEVFVNTSPFGIPGFLAAESLYLHQVIAFAGHEIEAFGDIYVNDEVYNSSSSYYPRIKIVKRLGTATQSVVTSSEIGGVQIPSEWDSTCTLSGIAYLYVMMEHDADKFPNGVPSITAVVKGKKVYDPRTSTTAWSDNPALCIRDYLTSDYGLEESAVNVDDSTVSTAANVCEYFNYPTLTGGKRFSCNGAFIVSIPPIDILNDLLTSMGGMVWYSQGKWRMKPAYYTASALSLDEDDLRSSISLSTRHSRRDNFNVVRGTWKGPQSNYQVTDYPQVPSATAVNPFLQIDNGQESVIDFNLPFTDNYVEARRVARILLERNRQQLTVQASFGLRAFQVQVGDTVSITNTRFGWTNKEFEVVSWTFGLQGEYDLITEMTLKEISASVFDDIDDGIVYERDNTTLASPFEVPNLGINISTELRRVKGKTLGVLFVDVNNSSTLMDTAEVEFRKTGDTNFTPLATIGSFVGTSRVEHVGVEDGFYDIRVRATNFFGVHGDFNTISNYYVETVTAPPADVTNFDGNVVGSNLFLSWTPVPDLDLAHYIIRYSHLTSGAVYSEAENIAQVPVGSSTLALQNAGVGTYFIKAVDDTTSGSNSSVNPAVFVVTSIGIGDLNVVATLTENPSFAGVKSGVSINSEGYLELAEGFKFDSATGNFDDRGQDTDPVGLFDDFTGYGSSGIYYFLNDLDLGQKYTSRLTFSFTSTRFDRTASFDSATGNFDDRGDGVALFDGDPTAFSDTSVSLQLRHTDDDPTGTPTWSDWQAFSVSDITARAFEFRLVLSSTDTNVTPVVSALSATIDMQDRTTSGSDITFTGTTNITFDDPFAATPAIGLSLANLTDGDRYTITNKTRTGFTINTFTGGSASTNAVTLDYVAKGYGKELT